MELSWMDIALTVGVAVLGWLYVRARGGSVSDIPGGLSGITEEVRLWVEAAEQLYNSGKLPQGTDPGTEKFRYVMGKLKENLPGVSDDLLEAAIEQCVFWVKKAVYIMDVPEVDDD